MVNRQSVVENLRACLLSIKGGISVKALERDYRTLVGQGIPYRELGYSSLEQFLKTVENMRIFTGANGLLMFDTIPKENTAHLAALVAKQKSAPKKLKFPLSNAVPSRSAQISRKLQPGSKWNSRKPEVKHSPRNLQSISVTVNNRSNQLINQSDPTVRTVQSSRTPNRSDSHTYEKPPRFSRMTATFSPQSTDMNIQSHTKVTTPPAPQSTDMSIPSLMSRTYPQPTEPSPTRLPNVDAPVFQPAVKHNTYEGFHMPQQPISQLQESSRQFELRTPVESVKHRESLPPMPYIKESLRKTRKRVQPSVIGSGFLPRRGTSSEKLYTDKLHEYAMQHGLGEPKYKLVPRKPKGEPFVYCCILKVGEESFNSYPDEKRTPEEAAESVAKLAVLELTKMNKNTSTQSGSLDITTDRDVIIKRISQIVADYQSGLIITQVPVDYTKLYRESLPENWQKIIGNCPTISMETIAGKTILWPVQASENMEQQKTYEAGSHALQKHAVPPPLDLPEDKVWDVYVTSAVSTEEVWVRLIGDMYSDRFEKMAKDMEDFYSRNKKKAVNLKEGSYYAVEADESWHRVELMEIDDNEASVYFIDHGDEDTIPSDWLYELDMSFAALPQQAVACSLAGMEEFCDDGYTVSLIEKTVIGRTFVAEIEVCASYEKIALILFDTSTDEDVNMNQLLSNKIRRHQFTPELPQAEMVKDVFISCITCTGDVHVQMSLKPLDYINSQIQLVLDATAIENLQKASEIGRTAGNLYLAPYGEAGTLYRAEIVKEYPLTNEADIIFVDYGNIELAHLDNLILVDTLDEELKNIPYQAIRVNMHNLPPSVFNEKIANRLLELVPQTDTVLMKVVTPETDTQPPVVELFKRFTEEKLLVSINNSLALDPDLIRTPETSSGTEVQRKKRVERLQSVPSAGKPADERNSVTCDFFTKGIPPPTIPKVNSVFDVHVTMASNPSNFMVQAYENIGRLNTMMEKLQKTYNEMDINSAPQSVVEGECYAVLHSDHLWYRVKVISIMKDSVISVYFCDYGDVSVLSRENFRPLTEEFKSLPYQAIKAKLCAVKPIHGDWSVEDCLLFQSLVVEKQFVSLVLDTGPDVVNPHDTVLGLRLIDTSSETDLCIDELLVNQNRAVFISTEKN